MPVQITSTEGNRVNISVDQIDLSNILSYLVHAKFGQEIKSYLVLSPLINDLIRSIIDFSDKEGLRESGSPFWKRTLPNDQMTDPAFFPHHVLKALAADMGEEKAAEFLAEAIYPNVIERPISA